MMVMVVTHPRHVELHREERDDGEQRRARIVDAAIDRQLQQRQGACGAGRGAGKPRKQRVDACMDEPVQQAREHGQSRESDHRELQRPRAARDVDKQRSQMAQEQDSLPGAGLALPRVTRRENKRHVGHAKARRADQELEENLETPWL